MITKRETRLAQVMILVQVILSVLLFYFIEFFYKQPQVGWKEKIFFMTQITFIWSVLFYKFRLGVIFRLSTFASMIRGYLVTLSIAGILLFIELRIMLLLDYYSYSAYYILTFCIVNLIVLVSFKLFFYYFMRYLRRMGRNSRNVIIIADSTSLPFIDSFVFAKDWGYRVQSIITPDNRLNNKYKKLQIIKDQNTLNNNIELNGIDDIFYCLPVSDPYYNLPELIKNSEETGVTLHIMQESVLQKMLQNPNSKKHIDYSFVTHQTTPKKYISLKIKELFDILFSAMVIVLLSPLMALIALLIKLEDGGPVFFKQVRIGLNGRRFCCYKFRSMIVNAEDLLTDLLDRNESDGPTFKIENDPRITKIGLFLRKTSLDELPQFYNVIRGEMSVVGPRPPLLKEVLQYERKQLRRLSMRPGITCIWQVNGRNQVSFKQWMKMDLDYIDNWSFWLDIKIMLKTVGVILKANGQ